MLRVLLKVEAPPEHLTRFRVCASSHNVVLNNLHIFIAFSILHVSVVCSPTDAFPSELTGPHKAWVASWISAVPCLAGFLQTTDYPRLFAADLPHLLRVKLKIGIEW